MRTRIVQLIAEKEKREGRLISVAEIARATTISRHTIKSWIDGDLARFESKTIEQLCAYFECDMHELLYLDRSEA